MSFLHGQGRIIDSSQLSVGYGGAKKQPTRVIALAGMSDEDGRRWRGFHRLSDCELLLEIFHRDTHSSMKDKTACHPTSADSLANLGEPRKSWLVSLTNLKCIRELTGCHARGRKIVTCKRGLLGSPRDIVEPLDRS